MAELKLVLDTSAIDGVLAKILEAVMANGDDLKTAVDTIVAAEAAVKATLDTLVAKIQAIEVEKLTPEQLNQEVADLQAVAAKLQADAATPIP